MTMDPRKRSTNEPLERQIPLISVDPLNIEIIELELDPSHGFC